MKITAEMSLYPLKDGPVPVIIDFIRELRAQPGIEILHRLRPLVVVMAGADELDPYKD